MDRAVLRAYGWVHIEVPPYVTPQTDSERQALESFEDEVIDRLFVLNAERAREEKLQGLVAGKGKGSKGKVRRARKGSDEDQMTLGLR